MRSARSICSGWNDRFGCELRQLALRFGDSDSKSGHDRFRERLVILPRRIILPGGERKVASLAAVDFCGARGLEPLAGVVTA
jgi:hypothetical protein